MRSRRLAAVSGAGAAAALLAFFLSIGPAFAETEAVDCAPAYREPGRPETICVVRVSTREARPARDRDICRAIEHFAEREGLPPDYFARLIWRESLFEPNAVSPAGAEGVAQFMPATARRRGLSDSFNPAEALGASAAYLAELRRDFGNLGLAAAAYNAGEAAIAGVLAGARGAPLETRDYVLAITGLAIEDWVDGAPRPEIDYGLTADGAEPTPFFEACLALAATRRAEPMTRQGAWRPYGALIAAHRRRDVAERMFRGAQARHPAALSGATPLFLQRRLPGRGPRPLFAAMVGFESRSEAAAFCSRVAAAGGPCVVVKN